MSSRSKVVTMLAPPLQLMCSSQMWKEEPVWGVVPQSLELPQGLCEELDAGLLEDAGPPSELAGASVEQDGWAVLLVESAAEVALAGSAADVASGAVAELSGPAALAGPAEELLASAMEERASMTSLLMGVWLRGISTPLLELLCSVCAVLEDSVAESPSVLLLTEFGWGSSEDDFGAGSELAEVLSSQAFSVKAPAMPSDAAMALLAANEMDLIPEIFFFSIFIFFSCGLLNFYVRLLECDDHAHSRAWQECGS